jgi:uncharacterized membrane protein
LILVLPLLITVWLLRVLFNVINTNVTPLVRQVLIWAGIPNLELWFARLGIPIIGLLMTALFVYLLGLLGGNLGGRRLVTAGESYILRIPIVKGIYGSARQLLDAFNISDRRHFSRVVVVQYPRAGLWTVGFVTREIGHNLAAATEAPVRLVPVFLPTTPNPTSGWMVLVPEAELIELDLGIEDGLKLVVSGGIVSPDDLGTVIKTWPTTAPATGGE